MNPDTAQAIREHAVAEYPRESCGLIAVVRGRERYLACRNIATTARENFVLHPEDYAAAEDLGEIVAVVHSHPDAGVHPSEADRVQMASSGLPWYIVSVNAEGVTSDIVRHEPVAYEAPLVGRQFVHGVLDCYTLVRDYYQRELGITLFDRDREDDWWNKGGNLYMDHYLEAGFEPIRGPIQKHDVIVMQVRSPVPNHAGIYIGDSMILHHMYGRLSSRDIYGGYFQETTRMIARYTKC